MTRKYGWNYYTEGDDSKGKTDPRKRAIVWNGGVFEVDTKQDLFHGDLDDYRLRVIKEDTSFGNEHMPMCKVILAERGEPVFIACNGKLYEIPHESYSTPEERKEKEIKELERKIRILRGEESDIGEGGLRALFG